MMSAISVAVVQYLLRSRANHCPSKIKRGYGHPRPAGAPEGTAEIDGAGAGHGPRFSSCGVVVYTATRMTPAQFPHHRRRT